MVGTSFIAGLVPRIAALQRCAPSEHAMLQRAIDLPAIATRADHKEDLAPRATRLASRFAFVLQSLAADTTISCLAREMRRGSAGRDTRRVQPGRGLRLLPGPSLFPSSCLRCGRYRDRRELRQFAANSSGSRWPSTSDSPGHFASSGITHNMWISARKRSARAAAHSRLAVGRASPATANRTRRELGNMSGRWLHMEACTCISSSSLDAGMSASHRKQSDVSYLGPSWPGFKRCALEFKHPETRSIP